MWYLSTLASFPGSANRLACWSSVMLSNAASVGTKMVNGPGPLRVSTRPATDSSPLTYLLYACSARAFSMMFAIECFSFFSNKLHLRLRQCVSILGTMRMGQDMYPHQLPCVLESA